MLEPSAGTTAVLAAEGSMGATLGLWTALPFLGLLLSIAILPLVAHHWWESNRNRALIAALFGLPVAAYLLLVHGSAGGTALLHAGEEYVAFILLLGALFVISGGVYVRGSLVGTPALNTALLALGAVLANAIGTTGASMLLVRPFMRMNAHRASRTHQLVFFIFTVANCGGLLTPLGDPPLFLGFLKGVPFEWTFQLVPQWAFVNALLLAVFFAWDSALARREVAKPPAAGGERLGLSGAHNLLLLAGVAFLIWAKGDGLLNGGEPWPFGVLEGLLALLALVGWFSTAPALRGANGFSFAPIIEVAVLFAGIFTAMVPALAILNAWGQGQRLVLGSAFGLDQPWQFFWATGLLSSFLDNAPTYLTMSATAAGMLGVPLEGAFMSRFLAAGESAPLLLAAISCGAVFMGANTYIGNGPNFMVKAIAEQSGVKMPSFFGYMGYSALVLLPIFALTTFVFFR